MSKMAPYLAFIAGVLIALIAVPDAVRNIIIASEVDTYTTTRGQLLLHTTQEHPKGPSTEMVKFKYNVGNREYERDNYWTRAADTPENIKPLIRKEKNGTKTILVYYDPAQPKHAVIRKDVPVAVPVLIIGVALLLLFGSIMSFRTDKRRRAIIDRNKPRARASDATESE